MKPASRARATLENWLHGQWSKKGLFSLVFSPLSLAFLAVSRYREKHATPKRLPVPVVIVGNIYVGGTGKTPVTIAIARGLMKDAQILILDDALSAVDTDTEARILSALKARRAGKTTILIAHRISTVQNADQILLIENGICAESGTHQELLAQGGSYAKLYEQQQLELQLQAEKEALHAEQ